MLRFFDIAYLTIMTIVLLGFGWLAGTVATAEKFGFDGELKTLWVVGPVAFSFILYFIVRLFEIIYTKGRDDMIKDMADHETQEADDLLP